MRYFFAFLLTLFLSHAAAFFNSAFAATYEADFVPWSGYWWPLSKGELVKKIGGHYAPLQKYDYVVNGNYYGSVYTQGLNQFYDEDALSWFGLCFNWACSAVLEDEPVKKGVYNGEVFNIGDKKGLLAAAYSGALYTRTSIEAPEDFQTALENFIRDQRIPVVMNLRFNNEFWSYPIYKYDIDYVEVGDTRTYTVTLYYADDGVSPDYVGTRVESYTYEYYYILDGDIITESGWIQGAGEYPPRHAYDVYGTDTADFNFSYETITAIVGMDDDGFEDNNLFETAAHLSSGRHMMLAIDPDFYLFDLKKGDRVNVRLDNHNNNLSISLYSPEQNLILSATGEEGETLNADTDGTYYLGINGADQNDQPEYELYIQHRMAHQGIFMMKPSGTWSTELSLLSAADTPGRSKATLIDGDGHPVVGSPDFTENAAHISGTLANAFGIVDSTTTGYVRIDSDQPFSGFQMVTDERYIAMAGNFQTTDTAADALFFPNVARTNGWQTFIGLINTGDETEDIVLSSYDADGVFIKNDTIALAPGALYSADAASLSVMTSAAKTMTAATVSGNHDLAGYREIRDPSFGARGRALVSCNQAGAHHLVLPQVAMNWYWWTGVALINQGNEEGLVTALAYDNEGNLLGQVEFLLKPKQNFARLASDFIDGVAMEEIASMAFTADSELSGFVAYGTSSTIQLAGMPLPGPGESALTLADIRFDDSWWTGIAVYNDSDQATEVILSLHRSGGQLLSQKTRVLQPHQRMSELIEWIFGENMSAAAAYFSVESSNGAPLAGVYIMGTNDGAVMMGDTMP